MATLDPTPGLSALIGALVCALVSVLVVLPACVVI